MQESETLLLFRLPAGLFVWQYVCQDDYGNVDNSCWRFETACDQHSADKALRNNWEHSLSKCPGNETVFCTEDVQAFLNCSPYPAYY